MRWGAATEIRTLGGLSVLERPYASLTRAMN